MFPGSRTTPTVDGNRVYTSGPLGDLHAIDTTSQKPVWRKNIWKEFGGGELPRWAVVQHPLIYGNLLIVAPQTPQAGVVAYDKVTGDLKWKSEALSGLPSYVSPSIVKIGGEDQLAMITASVGRGRNARDGSVTGLDPRTGRVLWTYKGWQNPIPVPQPVDAGDGRLLITGGYGAGTVMIKVAKKADGSFDVTEVFRNAEVGAHTQPPILVKDHFYSHNTVNERNDGLLAMGMDGQVKWKTDTQPPFTRGGAILAEGLLLTTDGDTKLYLVEPNPTGFKAHRQRRDPREGRQLGAAGAGRRQAARPRPEADEVPAGRAVRGGGGVAAPQNLNRSSKACCALTGPAAGVEPVCRSKVVRGAKRAHVLRASLGLTRAGIACMHSNVDPGSNETHCTQACRSAPH